MTYFKEKYNEAKLNCKKQFDKTQAKEDEYKFMLLNYADVKNRIILLRELSKKLTPIISANKQDGIIDKEIIALQTSYRDELDEITPKFTKLSDELSDRRIEFIDENKTMEKLKNLLAGFERDLIIYK